MATGAFLSTNIEQVLRDYVATAGGVNASSAQVIKLKGDASSRAYYRVRDEQHSYVVMVMPQDASKSDEATKGAAPTPTEW